MKDFRAQPQHALAGNAIVVAASGAHVGRASGGSVRARPPADSSGHYVVVFRPQETRLRASELAGVRRWIAAWRRRRPRALLVAGCCPDSTVESRRLRLSHLRVQLESCGVSAASIRWTDAWMAPPCPESAPHLPFDLVWLEAAGVGG